VARPRFSEGLKTKNVDVVINKDGLGPVFAVSCKGMTGAFRNLTNRMEETIGECTNLHIIYPALVFGYLFVIRANRTANTVASENPSLTEPPVRQIAANDVAIADSGRTGETIIRFHSALCELADRRGIRNDVSRYEAIALALASTRVGRTGTIIDEFPASGSPLRFERFFGSLYRQYDDRFVYAAPDETVCADCLRRPPRYDRARSALRYDEASRDLVLAFKHGDRTDSAPVFARWLANAAGNLLDGAPLLVPVPLHRTRLFARRYNQSALLSAHLARIAGQNWLADGLTRHLRTRSQGRLGPAERRRNVGRAFTVTAPGRAAISGRRVVLIDDVLTTGATAEACAGALRRAGARAVDVLTLARVTTAGGANRD